VAFVTEKEKINIVVDAIAVLIGEYNINQKYAATILLKMFLPDGFRRFLLEDKNLYPYDRNDIRVRQWTKSVLSKGKCEECGCKNNLEAHHIVKWADYPMGRIDVKNGMCLCHDCHTEEHRYDQSYYMMKAKSVGN